MKGNIPARRSCVASWRRACPSFAGPLLFSIVVPTSVHGAVFEGWLPSVTNFAEYVGKFCYDHTNYNGTEKFVGEVRVSTWRDGSEFSFSDGSKAPSTAVTAKPTPAGDLYFLLFTDQKDRWRPAWHEWGSSSCEGKIKEATYYKKIPLAEDVVHQTIKIWLYQRPRFMYFSFIACGMAPNEEPVRYRVHTENGLWGWQREFSFDKIGLIGLYGFFSALFALVLLATVRAARYRDIWEHPYIKLLLLANLASTASCLLELVHCMQFMRDGIGAKRMEFLAVLATVVANCTIFLIGILAASGWAITYMKLPQRRLFLGLLMAIGGLTLFCEMRAETSIDQSTKLYSYQSTPGMFALLIKIFMFCWFAYQAQATHDAERHEKFRRFYKWLGAVVSFWGLNVPVAVVLAFYVSPWYRFKVVTTADVVARFLAQAALSWLFCGGRSPITAENTFPCVDSDQISLTAFGPI